MSGRQLPGPIQLGTVHAVINLLDAHTERFMVVRDRIPAVMFVPRLLAAVVSLAPQNARLTGTMYRWRMSAGISTGDNRASFV
jgi:hypothetical protein